MESDKDRQAGHRSKEDESRRASNPLEALGATCRPEEHGDGEAAQNQQRLVRPDECTSNRTTMISEIAATLMGQDAGTSVGGQVRAGRP